jgi:hypothetical protein
MAGYRLYILNGRGHIVDAVEFHCEDDATAQALAERHSEGRATELWSDARVVRRYEDQSSAA